MEQKIDFNVQTVLILYVGGTIGMQKDDKGVYIPSPNKFLEKIKYHSQMHDNEMAEKVFKNTLDKNQLVLPPFKRNSLVLYEIQEYKPLLDSCNMTPKCWQRIALDIERNYHKYDGFVILHGTDTLVYTSSVLSFMLEGLQKPVIITGAQIPIFETRSDAKDNMISSIILAGCYKITEVAVLFANKLLRGNRATKISADQLTAFDSPNYHQLADVGIEINVYQHYIMKNSTPFKVHKELNMNVALLTIFPTITPELLEKFLEPPLEGVVIQSYGSGNMPITNPAIIEVLKRATRRGVIITNVTQCSQGMVHVSYSAGKILEEIGIISGKDMTAEAALTKLCFVLAQSQKTYQEKIQMVKSNIRGELTIKN